MMKGIRPLSRWQGDIVAVVGGALMPFAFSPFKLYPLAVVSLALLFYLWIQPCSAKLAAWRGWLFGVSMFGVGVSWVFVAIHIFGQSGLILSTLLTSLFVAFLATYLALLGWLIYKVSARSLPQHSLLFLLPVAWVVFEAFKGWFLSGFPWLDVGVSQIEGPLAGFVPVIGTMGVSLLTALSASLMILLFLYRHSWALVGLLLIWGGGSVIQQLEWTQTVAEPIKVTMIQGNVSQEIKWNPEQLINTLELYKTLTQTHLDSDVVVWPENAAPAFYHQLKSFYLQPLQDEVTRTNTDILLGLPVLADDKKQYFNSMMKLGQTEAFYHKRHLVPFGDYVPFEWLRGLINFLNLPMSSFSPGPQQQELLTVAGQPIATTICYEDVFSSEVLTALPAATLLVNATNNAWYGDSFAPHQHLQISRSRALETGRELVRVTTNGISAFVDHKGRIRQQSAQFEQAVMTQQVQPRTGETPYVHWHDRLVVLFSVFMLLLWGYHRRKNQENGL